MVLLAMATVALISAAGGVASASTMAHGFDDPKLEREWAGLRARLDVARPSVAVVVRPARAEGASRHEPAVALALGAATRPSTPPSAHASARDPAEAPAGASQPGEWPYRPRLKVSYQRFSLSALTSTATSAAAASASEPFESVSLEVYPMSGYLRTGIAGQFGWQNGGQTTGSGDYFIAQSFSTGFQLPGRFTPFAEAIAGAGYMRRVLPDTSLASAYWQVGFEGGLEIYLAGRAYTSVAIGYLRTGNVLLLNDTPTSVKQNTWTLKLGIGI